VDGVLLSEEFAVLGTVPDVVTLHPTFRVLGKVLCSVGGRVELAWDVVVNSDVFAVELTVFVVGSGDDTVVVFTVDVDETPVVDDVDDTPVVGSTVDVVGTGGRSTLSTPNSLHVQYSLDEF
jgi:hypothetical protein